MAEGPAGAVRLEEGQFDPRFQLGDAVGYSVVASPIEHEGAPFALLIALGRPADPAAWVALRERTLGEIATFVGPLLGPQLVTRDDVEQARSAIQRVLDLGAHWPVYQPVVEIATPGVVGYEALTRFTDGVRPDLRFAEAAAVGLGGELEVACVRAALEAAATLMEPAWLSLNASPPVILSGALAPLVAAAKRPVVIELTEHVAIDDYPAIRGAIARLGHGVRLAVDDAGAGYASLRHVLELQPHFVKLDIGLVRGIEGDPARQALVAGMVHFAGAISTQLVAEGIETEAEAATLVGLGVRLGQGFLLGRPEPAPLRRRTSPASGRG
jgi:EAL domain-containing protein (putative c-di-GMP-specific phosphodiesterase class I)